MEFICVDVETANLDKSSICQIGWAVVRGGEIVNVQSTLIDPQQYFDPFNVEIHGITEEMVQGAPHFSDIKEHFRGLLNSAPVLSYGLFDQAAFNLADDGDDTTHFVSKQPWVNAQRIVRRAWPEHFGRYFNLGLVAETLELDLKAHDAGSDAEVAAKAVLLAAQKMSLNMDELIVRAYQRMTKRAYAPLRLEGNDDGELAGEVVVFTGALEVPRREAAALINSLGAEVAPSVTKRTTILVVGTQDPERLVGEKSSKHVKAEALISSGQPIELITESQFFDMVE